MRDNLGGAVWRLVLFLIVCSFGIFSMFAIFGHLRFALNDAEPLFEAELQALGEILGIAGEYRPPSR